MHRMFSPYTAGGGSNIQHTGYDDDVYAFPQGSSHYAAAAGLTYEGGSIDDHTYNDDVDDLLYEIGGLILVVIMHMYQLLAGNSSPSPPDRSQQRRAWQHSPQVPPQSSYVSAPSYGGLSARRDINSELYNAAYIDQQGADDEQSYQVQQSAGTSLS